MERPAEHFLALPGEGHDGVWSNELREVAATP